MLELAIILMVFSLYLENTTLAVHGETCLVPCDRIISGGPPKDGIPAIDNPKFISVEEFENQYGDDSFGDMLVIGLEINGEARAYPYDILNWHEIVNEVIDGVAYSITYCPLTGSGILLHTEMINGSTLGTTGKLYENNLVFYDRLTDSYWSQMLTLAITGEHMGTELPVQSAIETTWNTWKAMHPNTKVLSRDTGQARDYDRNPYAGYEFSSSIWFPTSFDKSQKPYNLFHEKTKTLVLRDENNQVYLFPFPELAKTPVLNARIGDEDVVIVYDQVNNLVVPFKADLNQSISPSFSIGDGSIIDSTLTMGLMVFEDTSGTTWNMKGEAIAGPLKGMKLIQYDNAYNAYWFAATAFYSNAIIFLSNGSLQFHPEVNYQGNATTPLPVSVVILSITSMTVVLVLIRKRRGDR